MEHKESTQLAGQSPVLTNETLNSKETCGMLVQFEFAMHHMHTACTACVINILIDYHCANLH